MCQNRSKSKPSCRISVQLSIPLPFVIFTISPMGSCCDQTESVRYSTLQTAGAQQPPPHQHLKTTNANPASPRSNTHNHLQSVDKQSKQSPPRSSTATPSSKPRHIIKKTSSINENAPHLAQYQHVHIVRPPSFIETSGQMAQFQDEKAIARLMNPNLAIRTSNQPYKPNLEWIREEPVANY